MGLIGPMKRQFFGSLTLPTLAAIAATHLLAIFVRDTSFALPVLIIFGLATLFIALKSLPHGLLIGFSEVFIGGHGHLIDASVGGFSVSIRMTLFGAVMLAWLILLARSKISLRFNKDRDVPWLVLALAVSIGAIIGFTGNEAGKAFDDANGYLAIGYLLPMISIAWNQNLRRDLLQVLTASVIWLVVFTLGLSFAFNHLGGKTLNEVYTFVRDARLAEVTLQTKAESVEIPTYCAVAFFDGSIPPECTGQIVHYYWYRIFMQSHFYVAVLFLILFAGLLQLPKAEKLGRWMILLPGVLVATLITSMSRSFILGIGVALPLMIAFELARDKAVIRRAGKRIVPVVSFLAVGVVLSVFFALVPPKPNISQAAFYETSGNIERDTAISSRWQLLPEMNKEIFASPILGSGFGEEVTFISDDPRIRAQDSEGKVTTYRFEWGWQDVWLKMGLLGILAFLLYAISFVKVAKRTLKTKQHDWLVIGLASSVVFAFAAHAFTPFLNHPIGIVLLLLPIPFLDWKGAQVESEEVMETKMVKSPVPEMTPAMRVEEEF